MTPLRIFPAFLASIAVLMLFLSSPASVLAQNQSDAEQTDDNGTGGSIFDEDLADTLEPYSLELFMSPNVEDIFKRGYIRNPLRIKVGLPIQWETDVTFNTLVNNPFRVEHRAGVADVTFGAKYGWRRWLRKKVSAATALAIQIPTGDHPEVSGEYTHVKPKLIFTKKYPVPEERRSLRLSSSVGLDILYGSPVDQQPPNTLRTAVGAVYPFGNYDAALEAAWVTDTVDGGSSHSYFLTPGVLYHVPHKYYPDLPDEVSITLRAGVRFGFGDAEEDVEYITRFNIDIPLKLKVTMRGIEMEGIIDTQWPRQQEEPQVPPQN